MSQRKRRQRRKVTATTASVAGKQGVLAAAGSGPERRVRRAVGDTLNWRDAAQLAPWLNRTAIPWCLVAIALAAMFFWQRMFPVAGIWVSTADLHVAEPLPDHGMDAARMTFMWQLVAAQVGMFVVAPVALGSAIRHAARQLPRANRLAARGELPLAYAVLWGAFLLLVAAWFLPAGTHVDGWVAALPLILAGQEVALPVDAHVVWLLGVTLAVVAYQVLVIQWIGRLWQRRRADCTSEPDAKRGRILASLVVVSMAVPILFAGLVYWTMAHWFATGGPHYGA